MDEDSEKLNRFNEAFERGRKGEVRDYNIWLENRGFEPTKADKEYLTQFFNENPEKAPNHQKQLEQIAEFIGFFSSREDSQHISVVGVTGIGKTQLLLTISSLLDSSNIDLPTKIYSAENFGNEGEELEEYFDEVLDDLRNRNEAVILVDDCDKDKRITASLKRIQENVDRSFLVTTWTPERWLIDRGSVEDSLSVTKEIYLRPFSENTTVQALETITEMISNQQPNLPDSFYTEIHKHSTGIPSLFVSIYLESLRETFLKELDEIGTESVKAAVDKLNLNELEAYIYDLQERKFTILKHILLSRHPKGRRPSELVELVNKDKSTISYHLKELASDDIVESEKSGRYRFYRVKEEVKPILQQRIMQEGEING